MLSSNKVGLFLRSSTLLLWLSLIVTNKDSGIVSNYCLQLLFLLCETVPITHSCMAQGSCIPGLGDRTNIYDVDWSYVHESLIYVILGR